RQFLYKSDLRDIHCYFGSHRPTSAMLTHFRIQYWLALGIGLGALLLHFFSRVLDLLISTSPGQLIQHVGSPRIAPYVAALASICLIWYFRGNRNKSYKNFLANSPGIAIESTGLVLGAGHPHPNP